ncbi:glutaredoxin family protein [Geomonas agri]|uniref:glutaredoxin family protein n=1 Tax=Geomonas agri TaxID=2873702 RepID=UPI001CD2D55D|nr:glutaredoxin domain-containing protein [Geomonas agri]
MESYFTSKGIPYTTRDIRKDQAARQEWRERYHGDMVPLIVFDQGKRIVDGCDVRAIERAMRELEEGGRAPR